MPISSSGQGFSKNTSAKQEQFRYFIDIHLGICKGIFERNRHKSWLSHDYHYIDLNAGTGISEVYGEGSPIIFLQQAESRKVDSLCYFVDIKDSVLEELKKNTSNFSCQADYFSCDNKLALENISESLYAHSQNNKKALYGLLYSDENGTVPPFDQLSKAFKDRKYLETIDILIYFSATNVKRCLKSDTSDAYKRLTDYIRNVPKKHWQIRESEDKHQWSFLFGTNWDKDGQMGYPKITKYNFHDISSIRGREILERLAYTNDEIQDMIQPRIPGLFDGIE
jgi:three-Cys-motif partner protein